MIGASSSIAALEASLDKSIEDRLIRLKKVIVSVESREVKNSEQLCRALVKVLTSINRDSGATPEQLASVSDFRIRVNKFDPRRNKKEKETDALVAACSRGDESHVAEPEVQSADMWDRPAPLPIDEQFRLVDIERSCSVFVKGESVLKPGTDTRKMLERALDGRPFTVSTLLTLYEHMTKSLAAGGGAFAHGALYSELKRVLVESGAIPPKDPNQKSDFQMWYENLLEQVPHFKNSLSANSTARTDV